jgi:hypothetical protein
MKTHGLLSLGLVAFGILAACASSPTLGGADAGSLDGAKVEITAEGGFAPMSVMHRVDHDTRAFAYSQRRLCGTTCAEPTDTADGTLAPATTDSLFNLILQDARALTKDDYGITRNGADMLSYSIRITADGRTRNIRGDDGSLPDPARQILTAVRQAISAGRH